MSEHSSHFFLIHLKHNLRLNENCGQSTKNLLSVKVAWILSFLIVKTYSTPKNTNENI